MNTPEVNLQLLTALCNKIMFSVPLNHSFFAYVSTRSKAVLEHSNPEYYEKDYFTINTSCLKEWNTGLTKESQFSAF